MMRINLTDGGGRAEQLAEIAELYYNQGKTQQEIAERISCSRFKVAKLLQEAREEQVVEIRIHRPGNRDARLEAELMSAFPLTQAIVVDTSNATPAESYRRLGAAGARALAAMLQADSVIGITWGKTIRSITTELTPVLHQPLSIVQLTGGFKRANPAAGSRQIMHQIYDNYGGECYYMNLPLYISDPAVLAFMMKEPGVVPTLEKTRHMDIILTGIGGTSSLPFQNPQLQPYLAERDREHMDSASGSLYGYILDQDGRIADIDLNRKLVSADLSDILTTPHRFVAAIGRHKARVLRLALKNRLFNELLTDTQTAVQLLENA